MSKGPHNKVRKFAKHQKTREAMEASKWTRAHRDDATMLWLLLQEQEKTALQTMRDLDDVALNNLRRFALIGMWSVYEVLVAEGDELQKLFQHRARLREYRKRASNEQEQRDSDE